MAERGGSTGTRMRGWAEVLRQDVRYGGRALRRTPGFTLAAVLTLGVGIGAATAMFSVLDAVLLQPLPVAAEEEVLVAWRHDPRRDHFSHVPFDSRALEELERASRTLAGVAGVDYSGAWPRALRDGSETIMAPGALVTGDFFGVLGVEPVLGRALRPGDDRAGAEPVMVVSHAFWRRHGSDPGILGRRWRLDGRSHAVVGVMPPGFEYPRGAELWAAFAPAVAASPQGAHMMLDLVGRLRPGATASQARQELDGWIAAGDGELPAPLRGMRSMVTPLPELLLGQVRPVVLLLGAAVGLLLVIACVNVAGLLLVRASARRQELAVRAALGARRSRLVGQLLAEGALLALGGGAVGVALALAAVPALAALVPPEIPRVELVAVDGRALAFALAASALTVLLFGLAPALWAARPGLAAGLRGGRVSGAGDGSGGAARRALATGQVALTVVVLSAAALLGRSLLALQGEELGFRDERLLIAQVVPPTEQWQTQADRVALLDRIVARVREHPGVVSASPVTSAPFAGTGGWDAMYTAEGQTADEQARNPWLNMELVSGGFFETMGVPVLRGRAIQDSDREGAPPVAMVSEGVARRSWPGQDPIGRRIRLGGPSSPGDWYTVVGVVPDLRYRELASARPSVYFSLRQFPDGVPGWLAVRTRGDADAMVPALREALSVLHPDLTLGRAASMQQFLAEPLARPRFGTVLLLLFAALATALTALGVYGVVAALVRQRTHEIGVRIALGAAPGRIRRLVLRQGAVMAVAGAAVGTAGALLAARPLAPLLHGVAAGDPLVLASVAAGAVAVVLLASDLPARRATRVDPVRALRGEGG